MNFNSDINNAANHIPLGTRTELSDMELQEKSQTEDVYGNLFVGSLAAAESIQFLSKHNITHVLTVAKSLPVKIPNMNISNTIGEEHADNNIKHLVVECLDHPMANILEVLDECLTFMMDGLCHNDGDKNSRGNILVHCASGVSRSVTVCAAYLMKYYDWDWLGAVKHISSTRKYANPNLGFRRQLQILQDCGADIDDAMKEYSKYNVDVISDTIRQRGIVNELHAKVDALEDALAKLRSRSDEIDSTTSTHDKGEEGEGLKMLDIMTIKTSLCVLQTELDSCLPTDSEGLADPPAKMIRKSAVAKVQRLLDSI
mmetsp:Transcript_4323/g.4955  ORF Transcript_4323/g.4955 Transcript_4323/m.4955 type:complete len:314 (+) Transcript_4323:157-1098(+)|eukprot:CAMPEP_0204645288 /NCGR_PEP_ID=MMETSP0718-20130828/2331_1 /ASSEMBLY_ACC=CAM_ASM_000674 /TAXON_ID=230516 /ORGANISM="Chaetoceros curvisetus" /LENGTH=313 /DNA_ID=CAMNT_0051667139 /DNA_START=102 /DNA_END=1043 /DNA_ORIENTATION=+